MRDRSFLANDTVKENSAKQRYVISDRRVTSQQTCRFGIIYFSLAHSTIYNNARKKSFLDVGIARWRDTIKEIHASRAFEVDTPSDIPRSSYIIVRSVGVRSWHFPSRDYPQRKDSPHALHAESATSARRTEEIEIPCLRYTLASRMVTNAGKS